MHKTRHYVSGTLLSYRADIFYFQPVRIGSSGTTYFAMQYTCVVKLHTTSNNGLKVRKEFVVAKKNMAKLFEARLDVKQRVQMPEQWLFAKEKKHRRSRRQQLIQVRRVSARAACKACAPLHRP